MNIHLPAILMFTRGTRFWHTAIPPPWPIPSIGKSRAAEETDHWEVASCRSTCAEDVGKTPTEKKNFNKAPIVFFWFFGISWCMVWVVTPLFGDLRLILVSKLCISKLQKDNLCLGFDRYYCTLWFNLAMEHGPCSSLCEKMVMFQFANGSMISTWINPQQKSHRIPGLVNVYITMENHHF